MRFAFALPLAIVWLATRPANAQAPPEPRTLQLAWTAPSGCPDHDAVIARIERMLGRAIDAGPNRPLSIAAHIDQGPPWRLRLAILGRDGATNRTLEDRSCERLADATALIVAVAIDPDAPGADDNDTTADASSSSPSPAPASSSPPPPSSPAPPDLAPASPAPLPMAPILDTEGLHELPSPEAPHASRAAVERAITVGGGAVMDIGILPGLGVGAEARIGVAAGALRVALRGDLWPERNTPDFGATLRLTLITAGLQACYVPTRGALEVRLCGAVDVGDMRTPSNPARAGQSDGALWSAMFTDVGIGWRPVRPFALRLELGPGVVLAMPRFVNTNAATESTVFQSSTVVGRAALIAELYL